LVDYCCCPIDYDEKLRVRHIPVILAKTGVQDAAFRFIDAAAFYDREISPNIPPLSSALFYSVGTRLSRKIHY